METERIGENKQGQPVRFVIDEGFRLYKIIEENRLAFHGICKLYSDCVHRHFGHPITIVDGYIQEPSTKDKIHIR